MKQSDSLQKSEQKNSSEPEHYFNAVKSQVFSSKREDLYNWLYKANIKIKNKTEERKLHKMKYFITANKLKIVYTVIAFIIAAAACNMPVTQSENVGNMITWSVDKNNTDAISKIDVLPWLKTADQVNKNGTINN